MTGEKRSILTLSRPGGGSLSIHPDEWPALVAAATEALQLESDPAVETKNLPEAKHFIDSPHKNGRKLGAKISHFSAASLLSGYYDEKIGKDAN